VQEEHIAAFVTVLYVDPATQLVHTLFVVTVHAVDAYLPAAHVVHAVQEAAFVVVLKVDPAIQAGHPVFARAVQTVDRLVPAGQTEQVLHTLFVVTVQAVD
jgi:hypothetical protein